MNIQGLTPRDQTMDAFDYNCEAELFTNAIKKSRRRSFGYRRFERAADAVRFAIEELPPQSLAGSSLEVDERRFDAAGIRLLYERADYPLERSVPRAADAPQASDRAND
jgi:hypothetical protein